MTALQALPGGRDSLEPGTWPSHTLALAAPGLVATLLGLLLFPPARYYWGGHELSYFAALTGDHTRSPPPSPWGTMPVPTLLAPALSVFGAGPALWIWALAQRASPWLASVAVGLTLRGIGVNHATALLGTSLAATAPLLILWSATGYFLAPAAALSTCAFAYASRGRAAATAVWGTLAILTRLESAPVVIAAAALAALRRSPSGGWPPSIGLLAPFGTVATLLVQRGDVGTLGTPATALVPANLTAMTGAGGPVLSVGLALLVGAAALSAPRFASSRPDFRRPLPAITATALLAMVGQVLQPLVLADFGARHLVGVGPMFAILLALGWHCSQGWPRVLVAMSTLCCAGADSSRLIDLCQRYATDIDHLPSRWSRVLRGGPAWTPAELASSGCLLAVPGGHVAIPNALDVNGIADGWRARDAAASGRCVLVAAGSGLGYVGDTRAERIDTLVQTLGLVPAGRVEGTPVDEDPWLLFGPGDSALLETRR